MANTPSQAPRPAKSDAKSPAEPIATFRFGDVSAAIFADDIALPDGKSFTRHNVSLRRSYRDSDSGEWKHSNTLSEGDLLPAAEALRHCFHEIAKRR